MNRPPSLASVADALRTTDPRYPWVGPTPDEDDVAEVLLLVHAEHQGDRDEPDDRGHWGHCRTCRVWWPCPAWLEAQNLAVQYLGRAADRVVARARAVKTRGDAQIAMPSPRPAGLDPAQEATR